MEQDERLGGTSASNAAADRGCAGRHFAQIGLPNETTKDSSFGQEIHDALYNENVSALKPEQLAIYEQVMDIRRDIVLRFFGAEAEKIVIVKERRFFCRVLPVSGQKEGERYIHSARLDFIARIGNRVLIIEYKTLPGEVPESPKNEQLRDQAVISARNIGLGPDMEVGVAIAQPLVTHNAEICIYKEAHIKRAEAEMFARVRASNDPQAKRTPNTISCKFCKARHTCTEYAVWTDSMLPADAKLASATPVTQWTPEMRAHFCNMRSVIKRWMDDCEEEMKRVLQEDAKGIPGWTLEDGANIESVDDPQELFQRFSEVAMPFAAKEMPDGPKEVITELFMGCVKITKKEFEAVVRKVTGLKGKPLLAQMNKLYDGVTTSRQNQPSLAKVKSQPAEAQQNVIDSA